MTNDKHVVYVLSRCAMRALIYLKFWKKGTFLFVVFIPYLRYFTLFFYIVVATYGK